MIRDIIIFMNGMVIVFDPFGYQIPSYQGPWNKKKESILKDVPEDATFRLSSYGDWENVINKDVAQRLFLEVVS
jgi:hypothetical protein